MHRILTLFFIAILIGKNVIFAKIRSKKFFLGVQKIFEILNIVFAKTVY